MDFFKSVFADDPADPPRPESPEPENQADPDPIPTPNTDSPTVGGSGWSFGGLIKTITNKSESVIETYRRDLKEFGSGLKKEIEVAHGSLENVSHVIDELGTTVIKGTAQIISQGKDAILAVDLESDSDNNNNSNYSNSNSNSSKQLGLNSKPYSRFEAQVRAIQGEDSTYCEEPEDLDDYNKWKLGFDLGEKSEEVEVLMGENGVMESVYKRVVPNSVDHDTFWFRYFYRVYKIKQAEDVRANIVKRAISREEEDLSWDFDDEEEEEKSNVVLKNREVGSEDLGRIVKDEELGVEVVKMSSNVEEMGNVGEEGNDVVAKVEESRELGGKGDEKSVKDEEVEVDEEVAVEELQGEVGEKSSDLEGRKGSVEESSGDKESDEKMRPGVDSEVNKKDLELKSDENVVSEGKADSGESCKGSDFSVVSTQPSMPEEEDLGWDEIEDLSSIDEKKTSHGGSPNKADLRKRLSAAEEEEDLSWDIEDDDEPAKA